jgi:D-alanyl-D-alanine carboxypeptidase
MTVAILVTATTTAACDQGTEPSVPVGYTQDDLRQDTDAIRDLGVTGVQARVVTPDGEHLIATSGVGDLTSHQPVDPDGYFRIASVTKPFTATVILQLVGEDRMALDGTVEDYLPGVVAGNGHDGHQITIRQLLQHTSGVGDDYPEINSLEDFQRHRYDLLAPEEIVARAMSHQPHFPAGEGWAYANTGYVLLGWIIEEVTGRPWHEEVDQRILQPLGLTDTFWPDTVPTLPDPHARAYEPFPPSGELVDVTEHTGSFNGGAGGGLIGTTNDLNMFLRALLGGELLAEQQLAHMKQTIPVSAEWELLQPHAQVGLGLFVRPLSCGGVYYGHHGGEGGYITTAGASDDGRRSVVVSMSTALSETLESILQQTQAADRLVDRALCDAS